MEKIDYADLIGKMGQAIADLKDEYDFKIILRDFEIEKLKKALAEAEGKPSETTMEFATKDGE